MLVTTIVCRNFKRLGYIGRSAQETSDQERGGGPLSITEEKQQEQQLQDYISPF